MYCQICGATEARFVRDHDHKSGLIRGILCEVCNSYLGVLVNQYFNPKRKRNYRNWLAMFELKILAYLKQTTKLPYPKTPIEVVAAEVL